MAELERGDTVALRQENFSIGKKILLMYKQYFKRQNEEGSESSEVKTSTLVQLRSRYP